MGGKRAFIKNLKYLRVLLEEVYANNFIIDHKKGYIMIFYFTSHYLETRILIGDGVV